MNKQLGGWLEAVRNPEYTGEHRCVPCTALNLAIAATLAVIFGFLWLPAGVAVLVVGVGTIWARGYLVPGTPTLTERYLPDTVLGWFDKETVEPVEDPPDAEIEESPLALLESANVVRECPDVDDVCLTSAFEKVWWRRIRQVRDPETAKDRLAAILELDPAHLEFKERNGGFAARYEGETIGTWLSGGALLADLAVEPTLGEFLPAWEDRDPHSRSRLIATMRVFLERCPTCDGGISHDESVRSTCCGSGGFVEATVECADCGDELFNGRAQ